MRIKVVVALAVLLFFSGCGLKTSLVVYDDSAPLPEISRLAHEISDGKLSLVIDIQGGGGAVAYQVDRAVIEPDCQCIGHWLRYYESSPSQQREGLERHIKTRADSSYAFRVRAEDSLNRRSGWSKVIKVLKQNSQPASGVEVMDE